MRVGIDASFLIPTRVGGAEFMVKNLVAGILAADPSVELEIAAPSPWPTRRDVVWHQTKPGNRLVQTAQAGRLLRDVNLILATNYATPLLRGRHFPPVTTIIHDLLYDHFPDYFSRGKRLWLKSAHLHTLHTASRVVAISEFVRDDILRVYGSKWAGKIAVVPNPISWSRFDRKSPPDRNQHASLGERPIILSVSAHWPHKNVATLIRAVGFVRAERRSQAPKLVLVGQPLVGLRGGLAPDGLASATGEPDDIVFTGHVTDDELSTWYSRATLFAFPSVFEGFGMPVVEALGLGIPTLTTRAGAIPEVTKAAAHYVDDPRNAEEWATRITSILDSPDEYAPSPDQIEAIRRKYDPVAIAGEYLSVMRSSKE